MFNKNKQSGFIQFIIIIVIAVFLLSYFHVSIKGFVDWFINAVKSIT